MKLLFTLAREARLAWFFFIAMHRFDTQRLVRPELVFKGMPYDAVCGIARMAPVGVTRIQCESDLQCARMFVLAWHERARRFPARGDFSTAALKAFASRNFKDAS